MKAAVVGHLEWVEFVAVERVPRRGEILHAREWWEEPGGGGAGAAVQLQKLTGETAFFTALGDDALGVRARSFFADQGLRLESAARPTERTRRAVTFVDSDGERTITVLGTRLAPRGRDDLDWRALSRTDAVYFTAGDEDALRAARTARVLVATTRALPLLASSGVYLDAVVGSALDPGESYGRGDLDPEPGLAVMTEGEAGGSYWAPGGPAERYEATPPPGTAGDRYGAGDSFAGGLTYALGAGWAPADAVAFAARCGAAVTAGRGPYEGQLTRHDLGEGA